MAVSAVLGTAMTASTVAATGVLVAGAASAYQGAQANKTAKRGMAQQEDQFNQQAAMEATRQQNELMLGQENLAQQQAALNAQNSAFHAQQRAAEKMQADARKNANLADIANNRATRKAPNVGAMLTGNEKAGGAGGGSTLLTGAGGAGGGSLGKSGLLGS